MLAEIGVRYAGLVPVVCVGEARPMPVADAASSTCAQLRNRLAELPAGASVVVAYEPESAIGADRSADPQVVRGVTAALREVVGERDRILYGGSASRGAFTALCDAAATAEEVPDGLFVGRAALKVNRLRAIVDEVALRSVPHVR
jgi:triosephosphate isomerase